MEAGGAIGHKDPIDQVDAGCRFPSQQVPAPQWLISLRDEFEPCSRARMASARLSASRLRRPPGQHYASRQISPAAMPWWFSRVRTDAFGIPAERGDVDRAGAAAGGHSPVRAHGCAQVAPFAPADPAFVTRRAGGDSRFSERPLLPGDHRIAPGQMTDHGDEGRSPGLAPASTFDATNTTSMGASTSSAPRNGSRKSGHVARSRTRQPSATTANTGSENPRWSKWRRVACQSATIHRRARCARTAQR